MQRLALPMLLMLSLMQGCQGTPVQIKYIDTGCYWVNPIRTNAEDRKVIPKAVKQQLVTHNDMYHDRCDKAPE